MTQHIVFLQCSSRLLRAKLLSEDPKLEAPFPDNYRPQLRDSNSLGGRHKAGFVPGDVSIEWPLQGAQKETSMRDRLFSSTATIAIALAIAGTAVSLSVAATSAPTPAPALKTSWGDPNLQGIWTDETD